MVPQAGLSEGPMQVSAGNLCFSDQLGNLGFGWIVIEIYEFQGNVMTRSFFPFLNSPHYFQKVSSVYCEIVYFLMFLLYL